MGHEAFVGAPQPLGTLSNHLRGQGSGKRCGGGELLLNAMTSWFHEQKNGTSPGKTWGRKTGHWVIAARWQLAQRVRC